LDLADKFDDCLNLHPFDMGLGRHIAKLPMVLAGPGRDCAIKGSVTMMTWFIDNMDQGRARLRTVSYRAMALSAVFGE
jgi:hypothetical protein